MDFEDIFYVYIGGMDVFVWVFLIVNDILNELDYLVLRKERYELFDFVEGRVFEVG